MVFGARRNPVPLSPLPAEPLSTRSALDEILLPALSRPPCLVAFSGGRDSSIILALAVKAARDHGLQDPIPITLCFADPRTREQEWQEVVIRHLDLSDWIKVQQTYELEVLGTVAQRVLERHGLYWPANSHLIVPLCEAASGGALLTGNGGDELFLPPMDSRIRLRQSLRIRPFRRAALIAVASCLPSGLRLRLQYRGLMRLPWLTRRARRAVRRRFVEMARPSGSTWAESLPRAVQSRYFELSEGILHGLAGDADVLLVQPFLDLRFIQGVAREAPSDGFPNRTAAVKSLFGDLLPAATVQRGTKATFTDILWGPESKAFAHRSDLLALDPALVDHQALRRALQRPRPDFRTLTPLQAAWLGKRAGSAAGSS